MSSLWRYGLLLVHDVPKVWQDVRQDVSSDEKQSENGSPYYDATEAFAQRVGFVRRTLYGDMWQFGTYEG